MNGMLQSFYINIYALLDPGPTFLFVTPSVARNFHIFPDILIEPFSLTPGR